MAVEACGFGGGFGVDVAELVVEVVPDLVDAGSVALSVFEVHA